MPSPASEPVVIIPLGSGEFLAFTLAELAQARDRAKEVLGPRWEADRGAAATTQSPENLLTAEAMEERTGVRAAWFLEAARAGTVPHYKVGRYIRFAFAEVRDCTRFRSKAALASAK